MGIGVSNGENRAIEAARMALENPLIENSSFKNAGAMLVNIIGGPDFAMSEYDEAAKTISEYCRENAEIIVGLNVDENLKDRVKIIIIATDFTLSVNSIDADNIPIPAENIFEERKVVSLSEIRQERNKTRINQSDNMRSFHKINAIAEDDYETPAFLRKKKMG